MAIVASDLLYKRSIKTGAAGNSLAQSDPNASLGKYISTTQVTTGVLHDLFDAITGEENAAEEAEYRCIFIHNAHASLTWIAPVVWIESQVAGGAGFAIGVDPTAVTVIGSAPAQAVEVADEDTAPAGVIFSTIAISKATGLALSDIPAGRCRAIWIRRTATDSGALANDGGSLRIEGDTEA